MKVHILGARGSVPVGGKGFQEYGGATSCFLVETEDQAIFLDAGSGILDSPKVGDKRICILLTHPHMDHLLGMPFFSYLTERGRSIEIFGKTRDDLTVREQIRRQFSPPLWPVLIENYPASVSFCELNERMDLGDVLVSTMDSLHPGGSSVIRLKQKDATLVYATDFEHILGQDERLAEFSKDADLLIYDGQYTDEEYEAYRGYGHSTIERGIWISRQAGVKHLVITHHDPRHGDEILREMERALKEQVPFASLAKAGEVIEL